VRVASGEWRVVEERRGEERRGEERKEWGVVEWCKLQGARYGLRVAR